MIQMPMTLPTPTVTTGSMGSARNAYYLLKESFKLAMDALPSVLTNIPAFYQNDKTYFLLRRSIYPVLFAMKEQDASLAKEWVRRHWPESSQNRVLQDLSSEGAIDYLEEIVEDLRAAWRVRKEDWQLNSAAIMREEADLAPSRMGNYLSIGANFLNPRTSPATEKEVHRMAANTFASRRYQQQACPFIEENGVRFSSLLRHRPSSACKLLMSIDSPAIQAGMWSRRENPDGCMALREVMMEMETGKGEMILSKFLQTFFTMDATRVTIDASRKMPLYYIADALIDAGLYARAQEMLRLEAPRK